MSVAQVSKDRAHWEDAAIRADGTFVGKAVEVDEVEADEVKINDVAVVQPVVDIEFTNEDDGTGGIAVEITDQDGDPIEALVEFWITGAAYGVVDSQTAVLTVGDDGVQFEEVVAEDHLRAVTEEGKLDIVITGVDDAFVVLSILGKLYSVDFEVTDD